MKISYISGVNKPIGSLSWAKQVNLNLSTKQKSEIIAKQLNPLASTARGIVRELISGNRGGIADMLYGMSPFNTTGKIDPSLKAQHEAALKEAKTLANQKFPLSYNKIDTSKLPPGTFFAEDVQKSELAVIKNDNYKKHLQYMQEAEKAANKKFPYLIYPRSNDTANRKYREIEIMWLNYGGNVDTFNAAVKEGVTKSPRNKTFNYLLGKFAAKTYKTKDLGLAIRAVVGAALGGDRFSWTDKDIFNPWIKKYGTGNISGGIGIEPVSTAATTAATTASSAWWVPILTKLCYAIIAMLPLLFNSWMSDDNNPVPAVSDDTFSGDNRSGRIDLMQYALPIGAAVAGYLLFFSDDKKD
jgi:hypothetical protein